MNERRREKIKRKLDKMRWKGKERKKMKVKENKRKNRKGEN